MTSQFEVLHALRVKGLARPEILADLTGLPVEDLAEVTRPLVEDGVVLFRDGAMAGYMLTASGRARAEEAVAADEATTAARGALAAFDEAFLPENTAFKKICHRWQMRSDEVPNDHTDAEYDAGVVEELSGFHRGFLPLLDSIGAELPRFGRYAARLDRALERVQGGDAGAFARPMHDSYHDIWMELHNDVVLSLGRTRGTADEGTH
jgi:hypothetical protein